MSKNKNIKVMMTTEGTYPHHEGGVSTWCDSLVSKLDDVDYVLYSIIMNPYVEQKYSLPQNAELMQVPLWGTDEPFEHIKIPYSQVYRSRNITSKKIIEEKFIPVFKDIVIEILSEEKHPIQMGYLLLDLYNYFRKYDYKVTFKSEITWDSFKNIVLERANEKSNKLDQPSVFSMIQSLGWLYRFFTILTTPIPKTDVSHSAAAAFCGVPCVLAKLLYNTPYLLTEHGVYLREQYLSLSNRGYEPYLSTFFIRMIKSIIKLNYAYADQVSPVCNYNKRWEIKFGVMPGKVKVIHNGVDKEYFDPARFSGKNLSEKRQKGFRVVSIARVDPVKDLISLIKAAQIVSGKIKDITFHVYGSVTVPEYLEECKALIKEYALEKTFFFEGNTKDTPSAYHNSDVIVLSSITEAFPYSVVEAMMMGKAIVATNVGGVTEALDKCGILVAPRKYGEMASSIIDLYNDEKLRLEYGEKARKRALELFNIDISIKRYYESYLELRDSTLKINLETERIRNQKLLSEKAYAMFEIGKLNDGILYMRDAIKQDPKSLLVPELMKKISDIYFQMGDLKQAENENAKANYIIEMLEREVTAS